MSLEMRVLEVFTYSKLNRVEFADRLKISNAVISHISSGRNKAGMDLVVNLLLSFPEIDPDWLLFGKGEMLRGQASQRILQIKEELERKMNEVDLEQHVLKSKLENLKLIISKLE